GFVLEKVSVVAPTAAAGLAGCTAKKNEASIARTATNADLCVLRLIVFTEMRSFHALLLWGD
ncbi:MAG: hypothetical protein ACKOWJ_01890, partial [Micrococcales bacterium]